MSDRTELINSLSMQYPNVDTQIIGDYVDPYLNGEVSLGDVHSVLANLDTAGGDSDEVLLSDGGAL